jgi:hypothetical protein
LADAAHFDLIYANRIDLTLCAGCGITLAGLDFALFANKGSAPVSGAEYFGATFEATSSHPSLQFYPFLNDPGYPVVAPILPNEVVGSVIPQNALFLPLILPAETLRNTTPAQVLAFQVERTDTSYEGPVTLTGRMTVGNETATFTILVDYHLGAHSIQFLQAARTSSAEPVTDARETSWGRIKASYR